MSCRLCTSDGGPGGEPTVGSGATESCPDDCHARSLPKRSAFGITRVQGLCLIPRGAPTQCSPTLGLGVPARCHLRWRPHSSIPVTFKVRRPARPQVPVDRIPTPGPGGPNVEGARQKLAALHSPPAPRQV